MEESRQYSFLQLILSLVTRDGAEDAHLRVPYPRALCYLYKPNILSLIHISEPTRQEAISYAVFCLKKKKNRRPTDELLQKKIKNNLNTELTEMSVFSAVAGNQLPNQLQKRVLPALFHLRCPWQSHQRSARGRTRLTTVTSISCRSF